MASHMRYTEEDVPTPQTVSRSEGIEAAESYYHNRRGNGSRRHTGRIVVIVILLIIAILGITGGVFAFKLMDSAKTVRADAREVMSSVSSITDAVKNTDPAQMQEIAKNVGVKAHNIQDEVHTQLWNIAKAIPVYGEDIASAQVLSDVLVDLADNAIAPLASNADIMNFSNVFSNGAVNIEALRGMTSALDTAAPVLSRSADAVEALPPAHLEQVSELVDKAKDRIVSIDDLVKKAQEILPYLPAMLGADGQTRNYMILAQSNVEGRSAGGFPGAVGLLSITDGVISMGDFTSGGSFQRDTFAGDYRSVATDEELHAFGGFLATDALACTYTPAFDRVGPIASSFWNQTYDTHVDGVFGVDPVFLQSMLALSGGVTASNGTVVDGSNAAQVLMHQIYWDYGYYGSWGADMEDEFFVEVASLSAHQLMNNLGSVSVQQLFETINQSANDRRFQVWFEREDEQRLMDRFAYTGRLSSDITKPEIGTYSNDDTWSKIDWYLKLNTTLSEPHVNEDGTKTYDVTTVLTNTLTADEAAIAPDYITGSNPYQRTRGDMITTMYFFAPFGGSISNVSSDYNEVEAYPLSAADSDDFTGEVYGYQYWLKCVRTYPESTTTFNYQITVPAEATEVPTVRTSPLPRIIE